MDLQRYAAALPDLFHDWGQPTMRPVSERLQTVLQRVRGMTTVNVLQVLNFAVDCLEDGESYLEIGSFQGATLIGAMLGHEQRLAYAADNYTEFDPLGSNYQTFLANLAAYGMQDRVRFHRQHFEPFLRELHRTQVRVGVYLYDGGHDYRSQLMGLLLAVPLLADRALVVVDDGNFTAVKQATWDFLAVQADARMLFDLPTPGNCHSSFWNGLHVLAWEAGTNNGYEWPLLDRFRQSGLLTSLDLLQQVSLSRRNGGISISRCE